ncbi:MAG: thiamine-phosphate pyrophosphorylase [Candidatus Omnitrophica bacterium]|nr:thiamine-phosphate pyrophosphorylase [Candidatus Omnitrophota bacterium]MBD3268657.1 thiamine-phosphate pyrophosphorylase [Candidatus Omnitrophota bacterium]
MPDKGILRIIDANFNRCKEGLRVIEDLFRFAAEEESLRKKTRAYRHSLDKLTRSKTLRKALSCRNSIKDPGRKVDDLELQRKNTSDLFYVNFQRVKESLRVMEECFKLVEPAYVSLVKKIRYDTYTLEKKAFIGKAFIRPDR